MPLLPAWDTAPHLAVRQAQGYTVIPDFLDAERLRQVRAALAPHLDSPAGRNALEGYKSERVYTLVGR